MNKVLRFNFLVIGLVILMSSVTGVKAQNVLGEVLRRMDLNNSSLQSLQSNVTMVKHNPQLNVSDTYNGSTKYLPKTAKRVRYIRLDWAKPTVEQVSVIGDKYELYKPSINQVYTGQVGKAQNSAGAGNVLGFMNMSKDELKENYSITFIAEEKIKGDIKTAHLLLTPKSQTSYKSAEIWVDVDGMPRQVKITEQNNDTTTVLLDNIVKNGTVKADDFLLKYDRKKVKYVKA
ncbi:MAG: outer-membrane lipoprotein carrier protein LolA [Pyrinomonadaceae bacterium]